MTVEKIIADDFSLLHYFFLFQEITDNNGVNIVLEMLANVNLDKDLDILSPKGRVAVS